MGSKICMNSSCGTATTHEWKKGWPLRSGGFAHLCYRCGSAYEDSVYCETFHLEESGWRECRLCSKPLHCGCIASRYLLELLDYGGVGCTSCPKSSRLHSVRRIQTHGDEIPEGFSALPMKNAGSIALEGKAVGDHVDERKLAQLCKIMEANECNLLRQSQRGDADASLGQHRGEEVMCPIGDVGAGFSNAMKPFVGPPISVKTDNTTTALEIRDIHGSLSQPSLSMTLGGPSGNPNFIVPFSSGLTDGKEQSKMSSAFQQGQRSRPILPKPPKNGLSTSSEVNKSVLPQARIARPPAEGRGKNHLLPRYWPRITDQELQKLSGDLKSTIVPLFEKVLSASDAGRIGRLVLPKACAEAFFPPISQSEGFPLRIQDVNGKEWMFQFRFWPNNNSRMYVLEGVTPCIQSMQLQAGDTVTFSRIDPGGKLVMGFRKATNSDTQEGQTYSLPGGAHSGETSHPGGIENLSTMSAYSGLFQTPKGGKDPLVNALSDPLTLADGNIRGENQGDRANEDPLQQPVVNAEKKRTRNIGSKSKRLLMHNEDALELRLTWEEAQDLLRPPPSVKPTIVTIEDHEFEEYDEPPVFGKRTIFASQPSGGQEQWAQCDDCFQWRRLPIDILLPPKWTCSQNVWDSSRCSCSAAEEISPKELENLLKVGRDLKKRKILESPKLAPEHEPSGLDALASAAVLGDKMGEVGEPSVGATTKHPRHRPGCTCIVCIQPPSGKGKHKSTCTCNVCMTVKRRFKTFMLRKKKRQSEREAEISQKDNNEHKDESELNGTRYDHSENEESQSRIQAEVAETSTGQIDLNCHPNREDLQLEESGLNMMTLVQAASNGIENYIKQNGIAGLISEQQGSCGSYLLAQANRENKRHLSDEDFVASVGWERDNRSDEGHKEPSLERTGLQ